MNRTLIPAPRHLRVLVLEDSAEDAELELAVLETAGFACDWQRVETRADLLAQLSASPWDLILADYSLRGFDGLSALRLVRDRGLDTPFVLVSGTIGEEQAVESLKAGVTDYVSKRRLERLVSAVERVFVEGEERRRRERAETERREEAEVTAAVARVARELIAGLSAPDLLERLCQAVADVLRCGACFTLVSRAEKRTWVPIAGCGWTDEERRVAQWIEVPHEVMGRLLGQLEHNDVVEVGTPGALQPPARLGLANLGDRAQLCVALRRGDALAGVLIVHRRNTQSSFTALERRIAHEIGLLASIALENARLIEEAQAASRLKSDFVATLSHELRTPLNVILGYTTLVLEGDFGALNQEQTGALQRVSTNAHVLSELACNMLDLDRLEKERSLAALSELRVERLLDELRAETAELQQKPGVSFVWRADPELPTLHTDPPKLKVALKNLLSNAVKFTDAGSVVVHATQSEGGVEISVADTGVGIPPEVLPIIFEAFRQGEDPMTRRFGGVGLGLYIVRQLVDILGARIEVESEPGRGSTFRVTVSTEAPSKDAPAPRCACRA